jgi:hypothetical protein
MLVILQGTTQPLPVKPEYDRYLVDEAGVLDAYDRARIDSIGRLRNAEGRPLYVVTLDTLPTDARSGGVERYARKVYDAWGVGSNLANDRGALLLIVTTEQKSAIAFGAGSGIGADERGRRIASDVVDSALAKGHVAGATNAGVRALSSSIASPSAWVGRGLAFIPVFAIFLAWLSYGRIRSRGALGEAERAAVFAHIGSRMIARQEQVLRAADQGQPISPSDPPS